LLIKLALELTNILFMKSLRITKVWTIFLVYILAGMAGANPLVLCLGEQGHIGIEATGLNQSCDGYCDVYSNAGYRPSSENAVALTKNFCGPCVDIPILVGSSGPQSQNLRLSEDFPHSWQDKQVSIITSNSAFIFPAEAPGRNLLSSHLLTIDSTITSLRTIIFLV